MDVTIYSEIIHLKRYNLMKKIFIIELVLPKTE